jgi:hypothetical protein
MIIGTAPALFLRPVTLATAVQTGDDCRRINTMNKASLWAITATSAGFALAAAAHAQSLGETIKEDATSAGHAIADASKTVGHEVADASKKVGHTVADKSKDAGHAIAATSKKVGASVKDGATKTKDAVTSDGSTPKR